jgi:hypothetical protein
MVRRLCRGDDTARPARGQGVLVEGRCTIRGLFDGWTHGGGHALPFRRLATPIRRQHSVHLMDQMIC